MASSVPHGEEPRGHRMVRNRYRQMDRKLFFGGSSVFGNVRAGVGDALRGLRSARGTTALALAVLSLALAAGTVTFAVVDAVAIRPVPYAAPERLVDLSLPGSAEGTRLLASPSDYLAWRERASTLQSVGAARVSTVRLELDGALTTLSARRVTTNLFDVLGVRAAVGRLFGPEQDHPTGSAVVLSHDLWVSRFSENPDVVGRRVTVDDITREVIGVLPAGVWYPITAGPPPDLYLPYVPGEADRHDSGCCVFVVGRLRPGVGVEQVKADVQRFSAAAVVPLQDAVVGTGRATMMPVLVAIGLVLLVACVNVSIVLLSRAVTRTPEFATRAALGASPGRLSAGVFIEAIALALASVMAGLVMATWGVEIAKVNLPPMLTRVSTIGLDERVLVVSIVAAIACGLVSGAAPAWLVSRRRGLAGALKTGGGSIVGGRHDRTLAAFLVANLAAVSALLVATVLISGSFIRLTALDLGFPRENVMTLGYEQPLAGMADAEWPATAATIRQDVLARTRAVPGVIDAAISIGGRAPLSWLAGPAGPGDDRVELDRVTPDYFRAMGIQIISGRTFGPSDRAGAPAVVIINDTAARRWFPDRDPVGQVVSRFDEPATVVGVVRDVLFDGPEAPARPAVYVPADQHDLARVSGMAMGLLIVRTSADPRALASTVRDALRPALAVEPSPPRFMDDDFRSLTATRRFNAAVMTMFGVFAVVIGAISVYGTMAFVVARQVRAIGLRMALGASPADVMRMVLGRALRLAAIGAAVGLAGAWAASSAFAAFVFGIRTTDPVVFVSVAGILVVVSTVAALVPALRAARLDPVMVMRHE